MLPESRLIHMDVVHRTLHSKNIARPGPHDKHVCTWTGTFVYSIVEPSQGMYVVLLKRISYFSLFSIRVGRELPEL